MARLITEWSSDDPGLADMLRSIAEVPEHSTARLELEAALHTWQAGWLHRQIGALRAEETQSARNRRNAQGRTPRPTT